MMGDDDGYKRGYREGFKDGMDATRKELGPLIPISPLYPNIATSPIKTLPDTLCSVCSIDWGNKTWGYVCYHEKCPTKVTC